MIHDPSVEELYKLKVDISTGVAERNNLSPNVELDNEIIPEETRAVSPQRDRVHCLHLAFG